MQECNIRLSNYISDIGGKSYRKVVLLITQGESRAEVLLKALHKRTVNKHGTEILTAALSSFIIEENRQVIRMAMERIQLLERQREECLCKMEQITDMHYKEQKQRLQTIPGISAQSAAQILAETGCDMRTFATASALVDWTGVRPRNEMSAKKNQREKN